MLHLSQVPYLRHRNFYNTEKPHCYADATAALHKNIQKQHKVCGLYKPCYDILGVAQKEKQSVQKGKNI